MINGFAARELSDSLLIELDERDEFPEELMRRMFSGDELGIRLLFVPFEYGAWEAVRSGSIVSASGRRRSLRVEMR